MYKPITLKSLNFLDCTRQENTFSLRNINSGESFYSVQSINSVAHKKISILTADDNTGIYVLMLNDGMRDFAGSRRKVLDI